MPQMRTSGVIAAVAAMLAVSCSTITGDVETLRVLTHDGFYLPQESIDAYTERTGVRVAVIREPDTEAVVKLLSRTSQNPIADVVVGIDSLSVAQALNETLVLSHRAIEADRLDPTLTIDDDALTPISFIDVCLNVDLTSYKPPPPTAEEQAALDAIAAAEAQELAEAIAAGEEIEEVEVVEEGPVAPPLPDPPATLIELTEPTYANDLVVPDPTTDRFGQYFVVALHHYFGEGSIEDDGTINSAWTTIVDRLVRNGMKIVPTWRDAYFDSFTWGSETGQQPVVLAGAQMPLITASLRLDPPEILETAAIDDACIRVVNYAGIVTGTRQQRSAGRFIDQMITPEFQFNLGDAMGSRPARADLIVPELFDAYGVEVDVIEIDPVNDGRRLAEWVDNWRKFVEDARQPLVVEVRGPITSTSLDS